MSLKQVTYVYTVETEVHPVPITKCPVVPACEATPCIEFHELPLLGCECVPCDQVVLRIKDSAKVLPPCEGVVQKGILARIVFKEQILDENDCPTNQYRVIFEYDDEALVEPTSPLQSCDIDSYSCIDATASYVLKMLECGGEEEFFFSIDGDSGPAQTVNSGDTILILGGTNCNTVASAPNTITIDVDSVSYSFNVDGDAGPAQTITNGNTLLILGGAGCVTTASATDTITIDNNPVSIDVGNLIIQGADGQAFINCAAIAACGGDDFSFTLAGSSGTPQTIAGGNTVTIAQGDGISTSAGATDTVTVTARLSGTAGNTISINAGGLYSAPSFTAAADSGSSQNIKSGDTLTIVGGQGCATVASATDTITVNVNPVSVDADNLIVQGSDGQAWLDCTAIAACAGDAFSITVEGTSGTPQTIANGDTLSIDQGDGITTTASATGIVTVAARLSATAGNIIAIDSNALYVPIQNGTAFWGGTSGGAANVQTITTTPSSPSYAAGQIYSFIAGFTNTTTTPSLNANALGALTMKSSAGTALSVGDIVAGTKYTATHDGTGLRITEITKTTRASTVFGSSQISTTGVTYVDMTGMSITINVGAGDYVVVSYSCECASSAGSATYVNIVQNGTGIAGGERKVGGQGTTIPNGDEVISANRVLIAAPATGSVVYKLQYANSTAGVTSYIMYRDLLVEIFKNS